MEIQSKYENACRGEPLHVGSQRRPEDDDQSQSSLPEHDDAVPEHAFRLVGCKHEAECHLHGGGSQLVALLHPVEIDGASDRKPEQNHNDQGDDQDSRQNGMAAFEEFDCCVFSPVATADRAQLGVFMADFNAVDCC